MIHLKYILFTGLLLLLMAGCTKERVYENVYQGLHQRERIVRPPDEPVPQEKHSYHEYQREREESLKKDQEERR
jgi:hypothetical protein